MKKEITVKAFVDYIEEFNYWSNKFNNVFNSFWLSKIFYLPIGLIYTEYILRQMSRVNREYSEEYLL